MIQSHAIPRKPHYISVDGVDNFFTLFKKIEKHYSTCFFLESLGEDSHISRYSVIGFAPKKLIWAQGRTLTIENSDGTQEQHDSDNPYYLLRELIPQNILARKYSGGLTG